MNIGIIGAGLFGKTLARKLKKAGHEIRISNSRGPQTLRDFSKETGAIAVTTEDTVKEVDLVILITPYGRISTLYEFFKDVPNGTIVMDAMNYYPQMDGRIEAIERGITHSEWVQTIIGRPVIKAVNSLEVLTLITRGKAEGASGRIALPVSGDNQQHKETVIKLVNDLGFDSYDAGTIKGSWRQQPGAPASCTNLGLEKSKAALKRAVKEEVSLARDIVMKKMDALDSEYMKVFMSGNYPDDFQSKLVVFYREYYNIPQDD